MDFSGAGRTLAVIYQFITSFENLDVGDQRPDWDLAMNSRWLRLGHTGLEDRR